MEKYILNLLRENSRIIIPEFGAFIIRQQNPPEIAFNSLLRFNDGILIEHLSRNSGISILEAQAKVSEYTEKLNAELKLRNRLSFNEIGWIWLDESGEKQFTPWKAGDQVQTEPQKPMRDLETILQEAEISRKSGSEAATDLTGILPDQVPFILDDTIKEVDIDATRDELVNKPADDSAEQDISDESFSLEESTISEPEINITSEQQQEQEAELLIKPKINLAESLQEFQDKKGIRFKHEMPPEETVVAPMPDISMDIEEKETPHEEKKGESVHEEPKKSIEQILEEIKTQSQPHQKPSQEKKKRAWIIPVIIIGLLVIFTGAGWLLFPEKVTKVLQSVKQSPVEIGETTETSPSVTEDQSDQESIQETAPALNESESSEQQKVPVVTNDSEPLVKKYWVVAGRFRSLQNAERYTAELQSKGFNAEYFATEDNIYTVCFNSFSSRESAETEMNRIRQSIEPEAWILYY